MMLSSSKLKRLRSNRGWSQEVLAKATGLSVRTIQRIEADGIASAESTLAIAAAFDVPLTDIQSANQPLDVYWTRKNIMFALIILLTALATIFSMFNLAGELVDYLDLPTFMLMTGLALLLSLLSFGVKGVLTAFKGMKYLFAREIIGGNTSKSLVYMYKSQIGFCYASAAINFLIGSLAILREAAELNQEQFFIVEFSDFIPIVILPMLYALIICEGLLRPLTHRLTHSELS